MSKNNHNFLMLINSIYVTWVFFANLLPNFIGKKIKKLVMKFKLFQYKIVIEFIANIAFLNKVQFIWRSLSLSVLTSIILHMQLTHLGSKAFKVK